MAKFIALWTRPDDVEGFEQHYRDVHMEITARWPGVQSSSVTRVAADPLGGEPAYYLVFEATLSDDEDLRTLMRSAEMQEAGADAARIKQQYGSDLDMLIGSEL